MDVWMKKLFLIYKCISLNVNTKYTPHSEPMPQTKNPSLLLANPKWMVTLLFALMTFLKWCPKFAFNKLLTVYIKIIHNNACGGLYA